MRRPSDPSPSPSPSLSPPPPPHQPPSSSSTVSSSPHLAVSAAETDQSLSDVSSSVSEENPSSSASSAATAAASFLSSSNQRVKLMCSYGGRILPRPHDNQLRYVGGESRIAVVSRTISLADLTAKLTRMFGSAIAIKYQLPCEDLDALISVTSDEDLENMMEEYDKLSHISARVSASASSATTASNSSSSSVASRLRLFLFPVLERSHTTSSSSLLSDILESNQSRERWFVDALNGMPLLPRVRSDTSSILSETPDLYYSSNLDSLEEWASAISYGNSSASTAMETPSPHPLQLPHPDPSSSSSSLSSSSSSLFASLIHHASSSSGMIPEIQVSNLASSFSAAPPHPDSSFVASSSSSLLSTVVEPAISKEPPLPVLNRVTQQVRSDIQTSLMEILRSSSENFTKPSGSRSSSVDQDQKKVQYVGMDMDVMSMALGKVGVLRNLNSTTATTTTTRTAVSQEQKYNEEEEKDEDVDEDGEDDAVDDDLALKMKISEQVSSQKVARIFEKGLYEDSVKVEAQQQSQLPPPQAQVKQQQQQQRVSEQDHDSLSPLLGHPIFDEEAVILPSEERIIATTTSIPLAIAQKKQQPVPVAIALSNKLIQEGISGPSIQSIQGKVASNLTIGEETSLRAIQGKAASNLAIEEETSHKVIQGKVAANMTIGEETPHRAMPARAVVIPSRAVSAPKLSSSGDERSVPKLVGEQRSGLKLAGSEEDKSSQHISSVMVEPSPIAVGIAAKAIEDTPSSLQYVNQIPNANLKDTSYLSSSSSSSSCMLLPPGQPVIQKAVMPTNFYLEETMATPGYVAIAPSTGPLSAVDSTKALPQQIPRMSNPSSVLVPGNIPTMPMSGETVKIVTSVNPSGVISSSTTTTTTPILDDDLKGNIPHHQQQKTPVETAHLIQMQGLADPFRGVAQHVNSNVRGYLHQHHQYMGVNASANPSGGLLAQYRAVGTPVVHITEGIPVQSGVISEKKTSTMVQRGPSTAGVPSPHYGYYVVEHPSKSSAHSGLVAMYNASSNVMIAGSNSAEPIPYVGGNPFVDDFSSQLASTYQDLPDQPPLPSPPSDQLQKRQMRLYKEDSR